MIMGEDDMRVRSPYAVRFAARESGGREAKRGYPIQTQGVWMACGRAFVRRHLADGITSLRILLSLGLLFCRPQGGWYLALYGVYGCTDMLDGRVARGLNAVSRTGAALDSAADLVFAAAALVTLLPVMLPRLPGWCPYAVGCIALIKLAAYLAGTVKFHCFAALHTPLNKAAGAALFCAPYLFLLLNASIVTAGACLLAGAAAVDELARMVRMKAYEPDASGSIRP